MRLNIVDKESSLAAVAASSRATRAAVDRCRFKLLGYAGA